MRVGRGEGASLPHWRGVPSPLGRGLERRQCPSSEKFLVFDLKMVNFGVIWCDKFIVFRKAKALSTYGIGPSILRFLVLCQYWILGRGLLPPVPLAKPM